MLVLRTAVWRKSFQLVSRAQKGLTLSIQSVHRCCSQDAGFAPRCVVSPYQCSARSQRLTSLLGKPFSSATLEAALDILSVEMDLSFDVPGGMSSYRKTLALSFLFKFWHAVSAALSLPLDSSTSPIDLDDIISSIHRNPSSGTRDNSDPYAQEVVGQQILHTSGLKHVTGEAVYVDDMPKIGNEGFGALVLSTRAHAKILSVDPSGALEMSGVVAWVSHTDLPSPKANFWGAAALDEVRLLIPAVVKQG